MKKLTTKKFVEENIKILQMMTRGQIINFAQKSGYNNASAFSHVKKNLLQNGIDLDKMREEETGERKAVLSEAKHEVCFYSDANAGYGKFGITDENGNPIWWGKFFDDDVDEQSKSELAAAKKAVWLAGIIREQIGEESIKLTLKVDAEWLCFANEYNGSGYGGKATQLARKAVACGVHLVVEHVSSEQNKADQFTRKIGFKKWQNNDLVSLVTPPPAENKPAEKEEVIEVETISVNLKTQKEVDAFNEKTTVIDGNLTIGFLDGDERSDIMDLSPLKNIKEIKGDLIIKKNELLVSFDGLKNLETIRKNLTVSGNEQLTDIKIPLLISIGGTLFIFNNGMLTDLKFSLLENIEGNFCITDNETLTDIGIYPSLIDVKGSISGKNMSKRNERNTPVLRMAS